MSHTPNGPERAGAQRTLVNTFIHALSSLTPAGRQNFQREVDLGSHENETSVDDPRARPINELLYPDGSSGEDLISGPDQQDQFLSSGRKSQNTQSGLANSPLLDQDMDPPSVTRTQFIGSENRDLVTDSQPNGSAGHSSSSVGGEISPSFRSAPYRGLWGSNAHASMYSGDDQYSHHSRFREILAPPLTSSHFVADAGQRPREVHHRQDDPGISQRRGRASLDNVTQRDSKRPSERPRDRDYHRRFSVGFPQPRVSPQAPLGGNTWPREVSSSPQNNRSVVAVEYDFPTTSPQNPQRFPIQTGAGRPGYGGRGDGAYYIRLICEGDTVQHLVWPAMAISELITDAGHIFGLDPEGISLVLFSATPLTLRRESTIQGPPLVAPNSSVMVFSLMPHPMQFDPQYGPHTPPPQAPVGHGYGGFTYPTNPVGPPVGGVVSSGFVNSRLLSSFKLPKFDGVSKNWKTWDRAFQRFLGLHQLDHVLEDGFLQTLWQVPGAKEANKFVYFLLEDSVSTGSLASKYIRQAAKWNGHEAYVLLHDGYVFSGSQSATILLAELSQLRLKRDENASLFCMRLVELIEDLEAIPGDSAV